MPNINRDFMYVPIPVSPLTLCPFVNDHQSGLYAHAWIGNRFSHARAHSKYWGPIYVRSSLPGESGHRTWRHFETPLPAEGKVVRLLDRSFDGRFTHS